jgi:glycogen operon protein
LALRLRQAKNILATLLLSQGTPMLLAGDEFGRTQQGNNNAYCQDNEISWVNWDLWEKNESLVAFVQELCRLRRQYPILHRSRFLTGEYNGDLDIKDVTWINAAGIEMPQEAWADKAMHCFGMVLDGLTQATGIRRRATDQTVLIVFNAHHDVVEFTLPELRGRCEWTLGLDTNRAELDKSASPFKSQDKYAVTGRSLLLFVRQEPARPPYIATGASLGE